MKLANTTKKISHKLVRETTKKIIAREKAEEEERKVSSGGHPKGAQDGESSVHWREGKPKSPWLEPRDSRGIVSSCEQLKIREPFISITLPNRQGRYIAIIGRLHPNTLPSPRC